MSEKVEWARAKEIFAQFGIGRSTLYRLAKEGRIQSRSIRVLGSAKGIRVFHVGSIRALLAEQL